MVLSVLLRRVVPKCRVATGRTWLIAAATLLANTCPLMAQQALVYQGHTYQLIKDPRNWPSAAADATLRVVNGVTGQLVVIEDAAENLALFDHLTQFIPASEYHNTIAPDGGNGVYVWIGANDISNEGDWIWDGDGDGVGTSFWQGLGRSGGSIVDGRYNNWGHYPTENDQWEPDNSRGLQDAAGIGVDDWPRGFAGEWNDIQPTNALYYLVEFDTLPHVGDVNVDNTVDYLDVELVVSNLFKSGSWTAGDLNGDGFIDGRDFHAWFMNRGISRESQAVPEPASGIWATLVVACWLRRRHASVVASEALPAGAR